MIASILTSGYFASKLYLDVMDRKEMKEDLAEINRVNYELFNIERWKKEALGIFQKKIREFEISQQTYVVLNEQVEIYLYKMYKQYFESGELMNTILNKLEEGGKINKLFLNVIKTNVTEQLEQMNLKAEIPALSKQVTAEIKNNEPLLKQYMQQELLRMIVDEAYRKYVDRRQLIYNKYTQPDLESTEILLNEHIGSRTQEILKNTYFLLGSLMLALLVCFGYYKRNFQWAIAGLTSVSVILLILGITLPMIDIDARLQSFTFTLLNEPIDFDEQVIYFQSKSIVEVTKTLWQSGGIDLKAVGALVLLFSIVFPFSKLILSGLILFVEKVKNSTLAQNIIFHLGKWSMADVFVVAIFMAYIGMYGVISSQLNSISRNQGGFAIETINYSNLSPGAYYFTAYTILSIIISLLINKRLQKEKEDII